MTTKIVGLGILMMILMCLGVHFTGGISGLILVACSFAVGAVAEVFDEQHRNK